MTSGRLADTRVLVTCADTFMGPAIVELFGAEGAEVIPDRAAQNFVANDTYYPPELLKNERFLAKLDAEVPAARLGEASESAELALFLASEASSFIYGQVISLDGGWS